MDIATFERESEIHRKYYESHRDQIRRDCAGKYVALVNGGALFADSADEARKAVDKLDPTPDYYLIFPAEMEPPFDLGYDLNGHTVHVTS